MLEIERKYDVTEETRLPDFVGAGAIALISEPEVENLVAVYFDTPEGALAANRIALRVRRGGHDAGWHIKIDAGGEGRREVQWPLDDSDEPPASVIAYLAQECGQETSRADLLPFARISNKRTIILLRDAAGFDLAEFCDDHVESVNLRTTRTDSWREWEVELASGAPDSKRNRTALLDAIEQRICDTGATPSVSASKLHRAVGG